VSCENAGTNIQPPVSQIGRWAIFGIVGCQIETYQHQRGLRYGSASFSGEKRPNLDEIMRNEELHGYGQKHRGWEKGV
jgi:hypothetical protein